MSTPRLLSNRYELGETLGYGGMSEVHHGHDVRLGREVAIKILRADLARDPQFQERFRREAQNAAALNHPAIVAVYDTGEASTENGPLPYIVMEFVEGRTLRDIVKTEGPMSQKRAMEVMADVCAALDFSHRHGIVHRDVKPANVMITKNGAVKVMDFGIARAIHDGQAAMTQTAAVIGTAQYLSPEQARGEAVDARSDVYAAGCVLYELITGEPPFTGDSPVAVAYQHVREDPHPPSTVNPAVSPELDAVVLKALAKGPANRYQSSAEMRSDLVRTLSGQRPAAPMVMSEDERTQVMDSDRRAPQRYEEYADDPDDAAAKSKRRKIIGIVSAVIGVLIVVLIMFLAGVFTSGGTETKAIPNVLKQTEASAMDTLRSNGFTNFGPQKKVVCGSTNTGSGPTCTTDDANKVIAIDPNVGVQTATDAPIVLTIGVLPGKTTVPDLKGLTQAEAQQKLTDAKLQLDENVDQREVTDPNQQGRVQAQNPQPGGQIEEGAKVRITVGKSQEQKAVPDTTGMTFNDAKAQLVGLQFQVVRKDVASDQPKDQVVLQNPNGGNAAVGTKITLSVSDGSKQQIDMPDVTGMTEDQAKAALADKGWTGSLNVQSDKSSSATPGRVSKSNPSANSKITKTQAITLFIGEDDSSPSTTPGFPFPSTPR